MDAKSTATFEVILILNTGDTPGDIYFEYPDLDFGTASYDNGASATTGIKDAGNQPADGNLLLVNYDNGSNPLVQTGAAIRLTTSPAGSGPGLRFGSGLSGLSGLGGRRSPGPGAASGPGADLKAGATVGVPLAPVSAVGTSSGDEAKAGDRGSTTPAKPTPSWIGSAAIDLRVRTALPSTIRSRPPSKSPTEARPSPTGPDSLFGPLR